MVTNAVQSRQDRLLAALQPRQLDALLVTSLPNIFYLTGFRGSAGAALFSPEGMVLWVDPRYSLQAKTEAVRVKVYETRKGLIETAAGWCRRRQLRRVGYDESNLTCRAFGKLTQASGRAIQWLAAAGLVESLRMVKDSSEIEFVRQACRLTAEVFEDVLPLVRVGASEMELAAELEYQMKRKGADGPAFETIVASGVRATLPHARPTSKLLEKGDLVIFDLGAILHGYASDMTRTVSLGNPTDRVLKLYRAVQEAQQRGIEAVRPGVRAASVDESVRLSLKGHRLDRFFTHSTGHGVGIEIHEAPRLGRGDKARLAAGTVVTVEPGVYLEGFGGIRIEDTVLVNSEISEVLTPASKEDWILG